MILQKRMHNADYSEQKLNLFPWLCQPLFEKIEEHCKIKIPVILEQHERELFYNPRLSSLEKVKDLKKRFAIFIILG